MTNLQIQNLSIAFGESKQLPAVMNLNFEIAPGQCLGLVGESGSGKSITALSILQLLPLTSFVDVKSKILFHQQDLLSLSEHEMRHVRGGKIAMIFQDAMSAFNPVLTIGHQIKEALIFHQKTSNQEAHQRIYTLLEEVGISEPERVYHSYPHELSGGMRQRAMIALGLCGDPEILIADEPTTALDVTLQQQILILLNELKIKKNLGLLFISHDLAIVSQLSDEIVVLRHGQEVEAAPSKVFFSYPQQPYSQLLLNSVLPATPRKLPTVTESLLQVKNLSVHFRTHSNLLKRKNVDFKAVDDVTFTIPKGQTLALVGESGSGKTTIAKAILRLIPTQQTQGSIYYLGGNISELSTRRFRKMRDHMQIIFQDPYAALNPRMVVIDAIAEGLRAQNKTSSKKIEYLVDEVLERVRLPLKAKWRYPHEFSGGEKQRICIARALILKPQLLILDEPTSALDSSIQIQILQLLDDLQQERQLSYLLITHSLSVVAYLAHQVTVLRHGKIVEQGSAQNILQHPEQEYTKRLLAAVPKIKSDLAVMS